MISIIHLIILHSIIQIFSFILGYTYNYSVPGIVAQSLVTITVSIFSWLNRAGNEDTLSIGTAYARKQSMCCNTLSHRPTCRLEKLISQIIIILSRHFICILCRQCTLNSNIFLTIHHVWTNLVIKLLTSFQECHQL